MLMFLLLFLANVIFLSLFTASKIWGFIFYRKMRSTFKDSLQKFPVDFISISDLPQSYLQKLIDFKKPLYQEVLSREDLTGLIGEDKVHSFLKVLECLGVPKLKDTSLIYNACLTTKPLKGELNTALSYLDTIGDEALHHYFEKMTKARFNKKNKNIGLSFFNSNKEFIKLLNFLQLDQIVDDIREKSNFKKFRNNVKIVNKYYADFFEALVGAIYLEFPQYLDSILNKIFLDYYKDDLVYVLGLEKENINNKKANPKKTSKDIQIIKNEVAKIFPNLKVYTAEESGGYFSSVYIGDDKNFISCGYSEDEKISIFLALDNLLKRDSRTKVREKKESIPTIISWEEKVALKELKKEEKKKKKAEEKASSEPNAELSTNDLLTFQSKGWKIKGAS